VRFSFFSLHGAKAGSAWWCRTFCVICLTKCFLVAISIQNSASILFPLLDRGKKGNGCEAPLAYHDLYNIISSSTHGCIIKQVSGVREEVLEGITNKIVPITRNVQPRSVATNHYNVIIHDEPEWISETR
jgi:hypothetical protein